MFVLLAICLSNVVIGGNIDTSKNNHLQNDAKIRSLLYRNKCRGTQKLNEYVIRDIFFSVPAGRFKRCILYPLPTKGSIAFDIKISQSNDHTKWRPISGIICQSKDDVFSSGMRLSVLKRKKDGRWIAIYQLIKNRSIKKSLTISENIFIVDEKNRIHFSWDSKGDVDISVNGLGPYIVSTGQPIHECRFSAS